MDCLETLPTDCLDGFFLTPDDGRGSDLNQPVIWGRMFPLGASFTALDLTSDSYTFGRGEACDYQFNTSTVINNPCFQAYSKIHFKVTRETTNTGSHVFIHDLSINGTFLNGEKIGKGNKHILSNNDEISMVLPKNKAFVFTDTSCNVDAELPSELRDRYTLSRLLGRGAFGEVKLAFVKGSCQKVAVKIIEKKGFSTAGQVNARLAIQMANEVKVLKSVHHPCIIGVEEVIDTPETLYIVMELVEGGELFDRVVASGQLSESTAKLLFYQMVCGVKYLHDKDISHRDLKPENILLVSEDQDTLIKVTDFGMSKFIDSTTMLKTFCGTPNYLAPEVLQSAGSSSYTKAVDCWSLGVILFICLSGYPPFSADRTDKPMTDQILSGDYLHYMKEAFWNTISHSAKDLIKQLMCVDPIKRISLADALEHPWFKDDEMRKKAEQLMYPASDMAAPQSVPLKRKCEADSLSPNSSPSKKKTA